MNSISQKREELRNNGYDCWLNYHYLTDIYLTKTYANFCKNVVCKQSSFIINNILNELNIGCKSMLGISPSISQEPLKSTYLLVGTFKENDTINNLLSTTEKDSINEEGYIIKYCKIKDQNILLIAAHSDRGLLYGAFHFLRLMQTEVNPEGICLIESPQNRLRMINHWDNIDGSIERGYAGKSIFFEDNKIVKDLGRIKDYARLLSSSGINGVVINNVNVHEHESYLITDKHFDDVIKLAEIFRNYGIKFYLCANFASPIEFGDLNSADPLNVDVQNWWDKKIAEIYKHIPDFGGFVIKADSENRPGPFTYNRNHADGANMLAKPLKKYGGVLIWRCFVYNCQQDWRDHSVDRAKAAYDNFKPLDGKFLDNVILQIKNGPMDFQVREPVSPLIGGLKNTNITLEFQITQEYTGQQKHLCYLVPMWKEVLDFDTYVKGKGSDIKNIISGSVFNNEISGIAAVVNVGDDLNWTGLQLAQANLYGYGRLAWNPNLSAEEITEEWIKMTFRSDSLVVNTISEMLLDSWAIYEDYTTPLGIGWMVNPNHHFGPSVDGYEYSKWGTYHRADNKGLGVDRSEKSGTGFVGQFYPENAKKYEDIKSCPEELLLFFHRITYDYKLKSGSTLIQYIYDTHFNGVEKVKELQQKWSKLEGLITKEIFLHVSERLEGQLEHAKEWRDVINTYFYRISGISDIKGRKIY